MLSESRGSATLLAEDSASGDTLVVIRVQHLDQAEAESGRMFLECCERLRRVRSAFVATPQTFGVTQLVGSGNVGYSTRRFVAGSTLAAARLPAEEDVALRVALQLSVGLSRLHEAGVVHLDVKPENIVLRRCVGNVLTEHSQAVIIDCVFRPESESRERLVSEVSLQCLPPELAAGAPVDGRADLFSLGVVLYQLLTGTSPYSETSMANVIQQQRLKDFIPPHEREPSVSRTASELVCALLESQPKYRPQSALEVAAALENALGLPNELTRTLTLRSEEESILIPSRQEAVGRCSALLRGDASQRAPVCLEVAGSGVNAVLSQLADLTEAQGDAVIALRSFVGAPGRLSQELAPLVRRLARRQAAEEGRGAGSASDSEASERVSTVLDDLLVATSERRLVLMVEDHAILDPIDRDLLVRIARQERARRRDSGESRGRLQLVLGDSQRGIPYASSRSGEEAADVSVQLAPLSEHDVAELAQSVLGGGVMTRRDYSSILDHCAGDVDRCLAILRSIRQALQASAPLGPGDVSRLVDKEAASVPSYRVLVEPGAWMTLGLSLWGRPMTSEEWDRFCDAAECTEEERVAAARMCQRRAVGGSVLVRAQVSCGVWSDARYLTTAQLARLTVGFASARRSDAGETFGEFEQAVLRLARAAGRVAPTARWTTYRAMLLAIRAGRFGELRSVVEAMSWESGGEGPGWIGLLMSRIGMFECGEPVSEAAGAEDRAGQEMSVVCTEWLKARSDARHQRTNEALERYRTVATIAARLGGWLLAALEEYGSLCVDCGRIAQARSACSLLVRWVRRYRRNAQDSGCTGSTCTGRCGVKWCRRLARVQSKYLRVKGRLAHRAGDASKALECVDRELECLRVLRNPLGEAACLNNRGILRLERGHASLACIDFESSISIRETADDERGLAAALNNLGLALIHQREGGRAAAALARARVLAERNGLVRLRDSALLNLAIAHTRTGSLTKASRTLSRLLRVGSTGRPDVIQSKALYNLVLLALDRWQIGPAVRHLTKLEAIVALAPELARECDPNYLDALVAVRTKDKTRAVAALVRSQQRGENGLEASARIADLLWACSWAERPARAKRGNRDRSHRLAVSASNWSHRAGAPRLERVRTMVELCGRDGAWRACLQWIAVSLRDVRATDVAARVEFAMATLHSPQLEEGHDDLQIEVRTLLAHGCFAIGRTREAWALIEDAIDRFDALERKVVRARCGHGIVRDIHATIAKAIGVRGGRARRSDHSFATSLRSAAFATCMSRRGTEGGMSVTHSSRYVGRVIEAITEAQGDCDSRIQRLLCAARESTGAQRVVLLLREGERWGVVREERGDPSSHEHRDVSWGIVQQAVSAGRPLVFGDALTTDELAGHRSIATLRLRSLACVPVRVGAECGAVVYADHQGIAGLFGRPEIELMCLVGGLLALVLGNDQLQRRVAEHEGQLAAAQQHLVRVERTRIVSELTGGAVHDLRNVLTAVIARCQLLGQTDLAESTQKAIRSIESGARSANELLTKIQQCGKEESSGEADLVDVASVAQEVIDLLKARFESPGGVPTVSPVDLRLDLAHECWVRMSRHALREVILNLLVNALDAIPQGGTIVVRVASAGDSVTLEVSDNGMGMSAETRQRAFEPFFTTKGSKGTGLGLAIVKNAVVKYRGTIDLRSELGGGTRATLTWPRATTSEVRCGGRGESTPAPAAEHS